jgi:hypothetical protein
LMGCITCISSTMARRPINIFLTIFLRLMHEK